MRVRARPPFPARAVRPLRWTYGREGGRERGEGVRDGTEGESGNTLWWKDSLSLSVQVIKELIMHHIEGKFASSLPRALSLSLSHRRL